MKDKSFEIKQNEINNKEDKIYRIVKKVLKKVGIILGVFFGIVIIFSICNYFIERNKRTFTLKKLIKEWVLDEQYLNDKEIYSARKYLNSNNEFYSKFPWIIYEFNNEGILLIKTDFNKNNKIESNEIEETNYKIIDKENDSKFSTYWKDGVDYYNLAFLIIKNKRYVLKYNDSFSITLRNDDKLGNCTIMEFKSRFND